MNFDSKKENDGAASRSPSRHPLRLSVLLLVGLLTAGSTALGYYYYYVYSPPLLAADIFIRAMETGDRETLADSVLIRNPEEALRPPNEAELGFLLMNPFARGRILDQRTREGRNRSYHYLVYRVPGGQVYALVVTEFAGRYHVVIPDPPMHPAAPYLWDYVWRN